MENHQDVVIIGAGPAGLSLACALADAEFSVTVLERQPRAALADPAPDGRDIALTHRSAGILQALGLWQRFPAGDVAPIREARVLNGESPRFLRFDTQGSGHSALGYLVSNHVVRKAAFEAAAARGSVTLLDGVRVEDVNAACSAGEVQLADGRALSARLVIAADSRMSETRRQMDIGAELRDFGRDVIVCRMAHDAPSDGIAYECFGYGRTLAVLPLNQRQVSAVVTVPTDRSDALMRLPAQDYAAMVRDQFGARLGEMRLAGERYAYPLVAVYAHRFAIHRFALVGDAAVGMHPVTAHGFNFGLYGVEVLTRVLAAARAAGQDIGIFETLRRYEAEHRRATRALYLGTNALVGLFTDDRGPARAARAVVLSIAERLPPLKAAITRQLTGARRTAPRGSTHVHGSSR